MPELIQTIVPLRVTDSRINDNQPTDMVGVRPSIPAEIRMSAGVAPWPDRTGMPALSETEPGERLIADGCTRRHRTGDRTGPGRPPGPVPPHTQARRFSPQHTHGKSEEGKTEDEMDRLTDWRSDY